MKRSLECKKDKETLVGWYEAVDQCSSRDTVKAQHDENSTMCGLDRLQQTMAY